MDELSRQIMGRSIFGEDRAAHQSTIGPLIDGTFFIDHIQRLMQVRAGDFAPWIPTPFANRRFRAARTPYDDAVLGVIAERRRNGDSPVTACSRN